MNAKTQKAYARINHELEDVVEPLSREEYKEVLEELQSDIEVRIDAVTQEIEAEEKA